MTLPAGSMLGPYQIMAFVGSGGMGEVYRARDRRLDRTVAIKILNQGEAQPSTNSDRFDQEARAISALNHPHICQLYDVGRHEEKSYLVLEFLEGETLADRLGKGPLSLEQALRVGISMCGALESAHRRGIVHRDLKPGNIMLTKTGAKLMDFGVAKYVTTIDTDIEQTSAHPPTPVTQEGALVGTLPYMSPEQMLGKPVDARSDLFSLGAVMYEMITGRRAFGGDSQLRVISDVLERDPAPIAAIKPQVPAALVHAIMTCLAKDPEARWQSAQDLELQLQWIARGDNGRPDATAPQSKRHTRLPSIVPWMLAVALALLCVLLAVRSFYQPHAGDGAVRSSLLPPPGASFLPYNFAISPDGSRLVFAALGADGRTSLWLRGLSSAGAQPLADTDDATFPFWAPDSLHVGFFARGRMKSIDLLHSEVKIICDASPGFGGTWNRDGVIVFAPAVIGPLYRVAASGGIPETVTQTSMEAHLWPSFLPDGKHFLYFATWSGAASAHHDGLYAGSLTGEAPRLISSEITGNAFFASGHLLYVRDRTIMAQPFDPDRLVMRGPATRVTQPELDKFFDFWESGFSVAGNGRLVFQSAADAAARLVWYDPAGKEAGQFPELGYEGPQFSPDGQALAVYSDDEHNGRHFVRVYDLKRGISTRLTDGGTETSAIWSHDGKWIAYRDAALNIEQVPADGSTPAQLLVKGTNVIPCDWAPNGDLIYMSVGDGGAFPSLRLYSARDRTTTQFARFGSEARFSPDGKWVAYIGLPVHQILVQPARGPGSHIQISNGPGASQPRWSHDGKRLYYVLANRDLMSVSFDAEKGTAGVPQLFARTRIVVTLFGGFQWDLSPDGRALINSLPANSSPLTLISGWNALEASDSSPKN